MVNGEVSTASSACWTDSPAAGGSRMQLTTHPLQQRRTKIVTSQARSRVSGPSAAPRPAPWFARLVADRRSLQASGRLVSSRVAASRTWVHLGHEPHADHARVYVTALIGLSGLACPIPGSRLAARGSPWPACIDG